MEGRACLIYVLLRHPSSGASCLVAILSITPGVHVYDSTSWCRIVAYGQEHQGLGGFFGVDECNLLACIGASALTTRGNLGESCGTDMLGLECHVR